MDINFKPDMSQYNADKPVLHEACTRLAKARMLNVWNYAAHKILSEEEPIIQYQYDEGALLAIAGFLEPIGKINTGVYSSGDDFIEWKILRLEESKPWAGRAQDFQEEIRRDILSWNHGSLDILGFCDFQDWSLHLYWNKDDYMIIPKEEYRHARAFPKKLIHPRNARIICEIAIRRAQGDLVKAIERAPIWLGSPAPHYKNEATFLLEHTEDIPLAKEIMSKWDWKNLDFAGFAGVLPEYGLSGKSTWSWTQSEMDKPDTPAYLKKHPHTDLPAL